MSTGTEVGVHNIKAKSDFETALAEPSLLVLDCMATWCGPCKTIAPHIVKMSEHFPAARFYKLDVDELPDVAQDLGVRAMPTFLVFRNGEKVGEVVGANQKALEVLVQQELAKAA